MSGTSCLRPCSRIALTGWLTSQANIACSKVSVTWPLPLHLVQYGDLLGRILAILSAVGRICWSILNRKVVRLGPSMLCLAMLQDLSHWLLGWASSTLSGSSAEAVGLPWSIVTSSTRNLYISLILILETFRGDAWILLMAGKKSPLKYKGMSR